MLGPSTPGCTPDQLPAGICWEHWEDPLCFCLHTITGFLLFNMHADPLVPCSLSGLGTTWGCNVKQGQISQNRDSLSCYGKRFFSFLRKKKINCCLFLYLWKRGLSSEESKQHLFLWILHGCSLVADGITLSEMAISWVSLWTASRGSSCKVQFAELWAHLWEELHYMVLACWKH